MLEQIGNARQCTLVRTVKKNILLSNTSKAPFRKRKLCNVIVAKDKIKAINSFIMVNFKTDAFNVENSEISELRRKNLTNLRIQQLKVILGNYVIKVK
jgi:predicted lipase